ncbi:hypothetical protein PanWU01x14_246600 [Parasponia andersonii]|uniref:Uncharacterized protein n=1 Tax=Parasponia andersonii TaxID=3476 RepID=A0A2P5BEE1_PARAD|nr:hypothetical protein PanWU01x14_246600 [Parasponia andersonii]
MEGQACSNLCLNAKDRRDWLSDKNGEFSCKSCFSSLRDSDVSEDFIPDQLVWKSLIPYKIVFHVVDSIGEGQCA